MSVLRGVGEVAVEERPVPEPGRDEVLVIIGAFRYANTWPVAIALVASGRVDLDALVTGHYGFDAVEEALTATRRDPTTVKVVVRPGA